MDHPETFKNFEVIICDDGSFDDTKNIVEQYNNFKIQKEDTKEVMSEFEFMEGVDSYEKFKGVIKKTDFWADTWAISTLEKKLNMKCIILSEEAYKNGDLDSVLQCGQLNDDITNVDNYSPEYYIIVSHHGNHYQLISYKEKHIFCSGGPLAFEFQTEIIKSETQIKSGTKSKYYVYLS
jgi:glycosyltransferase involved in cell wall biosynthesis